MLRVLIFIACLVEVLPPAKAAEPLIVGVEDNQYLPHYSFSERRYSGLGRDILDAFFESKGYEVDYKALPVARLYVEFLNGKVDFKYPANPQWRPELKDTSAIIYSDPVAGFIDGVSVLPNKKGREMDDLKVLATVRGFTVTPWLYKIQEGEITLVENDSVLGMLKQALIERVDGVFANVDVVRYTLEHVMQKPNALEFDATIPYSRGSYRLATINHPQAMTEFNDWLQANTNYVAALKKKYHLIAE